MESKFFFLRSARKLQFCETNDADAITQEETVSSFLWFKVFEFYLEGSGPFSVQIIF